MRYYKKQNYSSKNSNHQGWYRIDPIDGALRNDQFDNPNFRNSKGGLRNAFRAHIGTESWGCVTFNAYNKEAIKGFKTFSTILQQTSTSQVRDRLGVMNSLGLRNTNVTKFGHIKVR